MGIVLAVLSVLVSCTEDDEYTRGQWIYGVRILTA